MREEVKKKFIEAVERNVDSYYELALALAEEIDGKKRLEIIVQTIKGMEGLFRQVAPLVSEIRPDEYKLEIEIIDPRRNASKVSNTDS